MASAVERGGNLDEGCSRNPGQPHPSGDSARLQAAVAAVLDPPEDHDAAAAVQGAGQTRADGDRPSREPDGRARPWRFVQLDRWMPRGVPVGDGECGDLAVTEPPAACDRANVQSVGQAGGDQRRMGHGAPQRGEVRQRHSSVTGWWPWAWCRQPEGPCRERRVIAQARYLDGLGKPVSWPVQYRVQDQQVLLVQPECRGPVRLRNGGTWAWRGTDPEDERRPPVDQRAGSVHRRARGTATARPSGQQFAYRRPLPCDHGERELILATGAGDVDPAVGDGGDQRTVSDLRDHVSAFVERFGDD